MKVSVNLYAFAQSYMRRTFKARGFQIRRTTPLDARRSNDTPRDLLLRKSATLSRSLLVDVPLSRCRSGLGTALTMGHPFVATLADGPPASFSGSVLEAYYRQCQPSSAAEVLGLPDVQAPGLSGLHAHAYTMPWWAGGPDLEKRGLWRKIEAAQYGYLLSITDGNKNYGPVSLENGELEILRLTRLYQSMSLHGYQRHDGTDGDVKGMLLTDAGGNWCVSTRSGQHRVAVAAALGLESIPVRINHAPVKREEVLYWPQVVEGRISPDGALAVFDRTMRGDPPPACDFRSDAPAARLTQSSSPA